MSKAFLDRPRRLWIRVVPLAAVAVVLAVVGVVWWQSGVADDRPRPATDTAHHAAQQSSPATSGLGPVTLLQGIAPIAGVYLGFPHSLVGAISAAGEYLADLGSTLDPDRAAAVHRLIADPTADPHAPDLSAQGVGRLRAHFNLPTTGSLAPAISFVVTPSMYQLRDLAADQVLVLILGTATFTNLQGATTITGVFPMHMHWDPAVSDWRLLRLGGNDEDYSSLAAQPGSPEADGKGWQPLIAATPITH
jgi:hypothetical protein